MQSRRDVLHGCLLAGISLALPRAARASTDGTPVHWTATWKVESDTTQRLVYLTVSPSAETSLLVASFGDGDPLQNAPHPLQVRREAASEPVDVRDASSMMSRISPRWQERALAQGDSHTFGPWIVEGSTTDPLHLETQITYGNGQTAQFTHFTGKPRFQATWEVLPAGRATLNVRVAIASSHDTNLHLLGNLPPGFVVLSGGERVQAPGAMSRAGPRRGRIHLTAGVPTKVGGWLVRPTEGPLKVALDLEHDGGQTHLEAELQLPSGGT